MDLFWVVMPHFGSFLGQFCCFHNLVNRIQEHSVIQKVEISRLSKNYIVHNKICMYFKDCLLQ